MKTIQFKMTSLSLLLLAGLAFSSCGNKDSKSEKNSKSSEDGTVYNDSKSSRDGNNSYLITVAGKDYSDSWKSGEPRKNTTANSYYTTNDNGVGEISLSLHDNSNDIDVTLGFSIKNGQPIPLLDHPDGTDPGEDFSFVHIDIASVSYKSFKGALKLSNLKSEGLENRIGGLASYDLEVDGDFRRFDPSEPYLDTEDQEQVKIKATFHIRSGT